MSAITRTELVRLRSPFVKGDTILMEFRPGVPPTLEAMIQAGFEVVEDESVKPAKDGKRERG